MITKPQDIKDVKLITPKIFDDGRGYFFEFYSERVFAENGINTTFVQDNHSLSQCAGTVRGLHYQAPPHAQAKLVRVLKGRIVDVAIDLRTSSETFGKHVAVELDDQLFQQLYIPEGFAHGFMTLTDDVIINYKVSDFYTPASDRGIIWNDPDLNIGWPDTFKSVVLSDKDKLLPLMADLNHDFD